MKLYPILLVCGLALGAEPDWPRVEKHALEFLETYVRIPIIHPPGNVPRGAELGAEPPLPLRRGALNRKEKA